MSSSRSENTDLVRKRSGWLLPLGVLLVIAALSSLVLVYYFFPTPPPLFVEQQSPTSDTNTVHVEIGSVGFQIPANYIVLKSARRGGKRSEILLFAALPDFAGWSNWDSTKFDDNGPNSQAVFMSIHEDRINLTEAQRVQRIYLAYVADTKGSPRPFGLTQYAFRDDSGYRAEDLFTGNKSAGLMVLHCAKPGPDVPSPDCRRDMQIGKGVTVTYRFKRANLDQWRQIADGVTKLMNRFAHPSR